MKYGTFIFSLSCFMYIATPLAVFGQEKTAPTAQNTASNIPYESLRRAYKKHFNHCDLLNAPEVLNISTTPLANLKSNPKEWFTLLQTTLKERLNCYSEGYNILNEAISAGLSVTDTMAEDVYKAALLNLDQHALDLLRLKARVMEKLFASMEEDLQNSLDAYKKRHKKDRPSFVEESSQTAEYIRQDLSFVLELERQEIALHDGFTVFGQTPDKTQIDLKFQKALHYLTRALMAYEHIGQGNPALLLAKLRSEYLYATGQLHEVLALTPELTPIPEALRPHVLQLMNRMELLELDVEGALRDYQQGLMTKNTETWLSELYQDMSTLSLNLTALRQQLLIGAPIVAKEEDGSDLPPEIADFIEAQERAEAEEKEQTTAPDTMPKPTEPSGIKEAPLKEEQPLEGSSEE